MTIDSASLVLLLADLKNLTIVRTNEENVATGLIKHSINGIVKLPSAYKYGEDTKLDIYILESTQSLLRNRKQALTNNDQTLSVLGEEDLNDILDDQESKQDRIIPNASLRGLNKYGGGVYN